MIDFYLCRRDTNPAPHTVLNYFPCDELDEASPEQCDESLSELYGVGVYFLECLYDSYLDEDMTLEMERIR